MKAGSQVRVKTSKPGAYLRTWDRGTVAGFTPTGRVRVDILGTVTTFHARRVELMDSDDLAAEQWLAAKPKTARILISSWGLDSYYDVSLRANQRADVDTLGEIAAEIAAVTAWVAAMPKR